MDYFWIKDPKTAAQKCRSFASWENNLLTLADKACSNTFVFTDHYEMERCTKDVIFSKKIDWDHIPFGDPEWCYAFNRHTFLLNLAKAYALTKEERYRLEWIRLFNDFYENSHLNEKTKSLSWRSLECGIRIENHLRSIEIFDRTHPLGKDILDKERDLISKHIAFLLSIHTDHHRMSNWGILQDHGLFLAGCYLKMEEVQNTALCRLEDEFRLQTMADGSHWEQSPMYQAEVLHCGLDTLLIAGRLSKKVPESLKENIHNMAKGLAKMTRPDGKCYLFGDSDEIDVTDLFLLGAILFGDEELCWHAKGKKNCEFFWDFEENQTIPEMRSPTEKSYFMPDSGNIFLSLDDNTQLRFHAGFYGSGHGHIDQLHFDLYKNGTVLLTDTGRHTYVDNSLRRALKSSYGHNTVIVDDKDFSNIEDSWGISDFAEPMVGKVITGGDYKYIEAIHYGYIRLSCVVERKIISLENKAIIIADEIRASGNHTAKALFHLDEEATLLSDGRKACISHACGNLYIFFLDEGETIMERYPLSKHYNEMENGDLLIRKIHTDGNAIILAVILLEEGNVEKLPVQKALTGLFLKDKDASGIRIETVKDVYDIAIIHTEHPEGGFLLRCGNAEAYARVFVSKNGGNTHIIKY